MKYKDLKEEDKLSRGIINVLARIVNITDISNVKINPKKCEIVAPTKDGKRKFIYSVEKVENNKMVMIFQKKVCRNDNENIDYIVYRNLSDESIHTTLLKKHVKSVPIKTSVLPIGTRDGLKLIHEAIKKATFHIGLVEANQKKTGKKKSNNYKKLLIAAGLATSLGATGVACNTHKEIIGNDKVKEITNEDNSYTMNDKEEGIFNMSVEDLVGKKISKVYTAHDNDMLTKKISTPNKIEVDSNMYGENDEYWSEPMYTVTDKDGNDITDLVFDEAYLASEKENLEKERIEEEKRQKMVKVDTSKNILPSDEYWIEPIIEDVTDKNDVTNKALNIEVTSISDITSNKTKIEEAKKELEEEKEERKTEYKSQHYLIDLKVADYGNFQTLKFNNTFDMFGTSISRYCSRYGIDETYFTALLSQERPDTEENEIQTNPAQISSDMIDEIVKAPVYDVDGNLKSIDEIVVTDTIEKKESYIEKGYKAYTYKEVINDPDTSIHVGAATFAYLLNMRKGKVINATVCYNSGYPAVPKDVSEQDLANGYNANSKTDKKYVKNVFQFLPLNEDGYDLNKEVYKFKYLDNDDNVNIVNLNVCLEREILNSKSETR